MLSGLGRANIGAERVPLKGSIIGLLKRGMVPYYSGLNKYQYSC